MDYTSEERNSAFQALPEAVKDVFMAKETTNTLKKIATHFSVPSEQFSLLDDEVGLTLLGLVKPQDLANRLSTALKIQLVDAIGIAQEIEQQIFAPVADTLAHVWDETKGKPIINWQQQSTQGQGSLGSAPIRHLAIAETSIFNLLIESVRRGDMKEYTEAKLIEALYQLPEKIRESAVSKETADKLIGIAQKNRLHLDKVEKISEEVGLIMLGLASPKTLPRTIARRAEVNEAEAEQIAADINAQIFESVRNSLKELSDKKPPEASLKSANRDTLPRKDELLEEIENPKKPGLIVPQRSATTPDVTPPTPRPQTPPVVTTTLTEPQEMELALEEEREIIPAAPAHTNTPEEAVQIFSTPIPTPTQSSASTPTAPIPDNLPTSLTAVQQKMLGVVTNPEKETTIRSTPVKKYVIDPYREPIE